MAINGINNVLGAYKSNVIKKIDAAIEKNTNKAINKDRVEFDFARSLSAAKANIANEVNAPAKAEEIEKLAEAAEKGTIIDSEKLADYILNF